jgi:hypothetical protein
MASNRGVVYLEPNKVEVQSIDYPKFENPAGKKIGHGVITEVISRNALDRRTLGVSRFRYRIRNQSDRTP